MADIEQLKKEVERLQIAVHELSILNDIATAISSTQPLEEIIDQVIVKCIKHLEVEEGAISLLEREEEKEFHTMIRKQDISKVRMPIKLDSHVTGWMIKNKEPLLINDIHNNERFRAIFKDFENLRSILCVPLLVKGDLIGYLAVFNKKSDKEFKSEDKRLLSIIASQSAQIIENARLYEEEKRLIGLEKEMKLAKRIQLKLLPETNPDIQGYQISALNEPAREVGGDYFDFIRFDESRLGFCVGDITGKGLPAALLMANLQASLRSQALIFDNCKDCLTGINKLLFENTEVAKFATMVYGILDIKNSAIIYCNGGHNHPILFSNDSDVVELETTGMLLGITKEANYKEAEVQLQQGDLLLLYTDGITEAMNEEEEEFGMGRVVDIVRDHKKEPAERIKDEILKAVKEHSKNVAQSDDITLMIIKKD